MQKSNANASVMIQKLEEIAWTRRAKVGFPTAMFLTPKQADKPIVQTFSQIFCSSIQSKGTL